MLLYRGDCVHNDTKPGIFWFDGLQARSFGKGDPAYIKREGLLKSIRQHIHHPTISDQEYYQSTDFISFSTKRDRAEYWMRGKGTLITMPCLRPWYESRYLFTMDIPENRRQEVEDGVYSFNFQCNPALREANSPSPMDAVLLPFQKCDRCRQGGHHEILLVDAVVYLSLHKQDRKNAKALDNAKQDAEWLVIPNDPLIPAGRSSTIQRADFWRAEIFNVVGEERDPMAHEIQGQII